MIFKSAFDELVQEVGSNELMDICLREMASERLDERCHSWTTPSLKASNNVQLTSTLATVP